MRRPTDARVKRPVRGIVFDFDGTLVDSLELTLQAFNVGIVAQGGVHHSWAELSRHFGTGEDRIFATILGEQRGAAGYAAYTAHLAANLDAVVAHSGVIEMLDELRSREIPIAIFTGRSWPTTQMILQHRGWQERFVTVVANDHVARPKPSPDGIALTLGRMGLEPHEAIYVGDSTVDILAAHAAGAQAVAALWDSRVDQAALRALDPSYFAHHPSDLLKLSAPLT